MVAFLEDHLPIELWNGDENPLLKPRSYETPPERNHGGCRECPHSVGTV